MGGKLRRKPSLQRVLGDLAPLDVVSQEQRGQREVIPHRVAEEVADVDDVPGEQVPSTVRLGAGVGTFLDEGAVGPFDAYGVSFEHGHVPLTVDRIEARARLCRIDADVDARPLALAATLPAEE